MIIRFWGVRGSIPAPVTAKEIQSKISAAISRITPEDCKDEDSKERFLSQLPEWIFGTVGGNSACVELTDENGNEYIFDCGSGIRAFSKSLKAKKTEQFNLFMSHFHWDHIQGIPFWDQTYNPSVKIHVYSPWENAEEIFSQQSREPYFPKNGCWDNIKDRFVFHTVKEGEPFELNGFSVKCLKMKHPGDSYAYCLEKDGKKFIYATDVELQENNFEKSAVNLDFFQNADMLIIDSQYTVAEALEKVNWGHNAFSYAVDFAGNFGIKNMYLFHHEPLYDDKKLYSILESARWYASHTIHSDVNVNLAVEGEEVEL